jgi:hypothetical protein
LIGIQRSLEYILTGRLVEARRAFRSGIIDRVIPEEFSHGMLRSIAHAFAVEIRSSELRHKIESRRKRANAQQILLEKNFVGRRVLFEQARKRVRAESHGHYPAPELALEAVERGYALDLKAGLAIEAELVGKVIASDVSKNLISVFHLSEEIKKDRGVPGYDGPLQSFHRIGVIGAGVMGGGIAQLMAHNQLPARMKDVNYAAVAKGTEAAAKVFSESVKKRRMTPKEMRDKMALITGPIKESACGDRSNCAGARGAGEQYFVASNNGDVGSHAAAGQSLRSAFFQSRASHAVGGSHSRTAHQRPNHREYGGICQKSRQNTGRGEGCTGLFGKPHSRRLSGRSFPHTGGRREH